MIYSNYVLQSYDIDLADNYEIAQDTPYYAFLLRDGSIFYYFDDSGFPTTIDDSYSNLVNYLHIKYYTRFIEGQNYDTNKDLMAVFLALTSNNDYAIINTSLVDFNIYSYFDNVNYRVFYGKPHNDDIIFDGEPVSYDYTGFAYDTPLISSSGFLVGANNYEHAVLDYYNIVSPLENEYYTAQINGYWNEYHYTNNFIHVNSASGSSFGFTISLGSTYEGIRQEGYDNGYSVGYTNGYHDGYTTGNQSQTHDAFSYIKEAFDAVGGIMTLEVLPHITLGVAFSIPLTIVLIMTIFKLVRK